MDWSILDFVFNLLLLSALIGILMAFTTIRLGNIYENTELVDGYVMCKIRFKDNEYDVHTVKLTKNDINNLKNGTTLMYFNEETWQVIAIAMEVLND